jgi:hypothetical protein
VNTRGVWTTLTVTNGDVAVLISLPSANQRKDWIGDALEDRQVAAKLEKPVAVLRREGPRKPDNWLPRGVAKVKTGP